MNGHLWKKVPVYGVILLSFLLLFMGTVCSADSQVRIIDAMGREVILDKPAERIAFSSIMIAESIKLAGAWDKVVGRDGYISDEKFYPNLNSIPAVSSATTAYDLDFEKIMDIRPDVFLLPTDNWGNTEGFIQQMIDKLEPEVPVVFLNLNDPDTYAENFSKLAEVTGTTDKAQGYQNYYTSFIKSLSDKTSSLSESEKPLVLLKMAGYTPDQIIVPGRDGAMANQIFDIAGLNSASRSLSGEYAIDLDKEWLVNTGPEIEAIIVQCWDMHYPETFGYYVKDPSQKYPNAQMIVEEISRTDAFITTKAVADNKIYLVHDTLITTPRFIVGIAYMAKWFHPDLFPDLNPEQVHRDYLRYIGADYDLNSVGLAGYP